MVQRFNFEPEDWCLARCNRDPQCRSVNYNKQPTAGNCELNSATNQQYPDSYKPRTGWIYFENKVVIYILTRLTYYYIPREYEGTERDTESVDQDMSMPLKLLLVSGSLFSEITTSV